MITTAQKQAIAQQAAIYMGETALTAQKLAELSGINSGYLSAMLNGQVTVKAGDGESTIGDTWWVKLAETVDAPLQDVQWKRVQTRQFMQVLNYLEMAKEKGTAMALICETGAGKTYLSDLFIKKHPQYAVKVTINSLMMVHDVINVLLRKFGLPEKGSKAIRLYQVVVYLREQKRKGRQVIIIFDEAENMELSMVKMMKGLYDGLQGYASLVLLGTEQLLTKMERLKHSNADAGPQFYRRFKAGIRHIASINKPKEFAAFFDAHDIEPGLRKLLLELCDNYGELNSYLEPAMKEAMADGVPLTEEYFRVLNNMRK